MQLWQLFSVGKIFLLLLLAWILVLVLGTPIRGFDGEERLAEKQQDDVALRGAFEKKLAKVGILALGGGGGLTQSQLFQTKTTIIQKGDFVAIWLGHKFVTKSQL